jgi:hypothetical protein
MVMCTHIRTMLLNIDDEPDVKALQTTIWPLPDDAELHHALDVIIRDAINLEMTKRGLASGEMVDLTGAAGGLKQ